MNLSDFAQRMILCAIGDALIIGSWKLFKLRGERPINALMTTAGVILNIYAMLY